MTKNKQSNLKGTIINQFNTKFLKCLYLNNECKHKVSKAHSIQNKRVLDIIADKGHVFMLKPNLNFNTPPIPEFKLVGINEATTFTGLCNNHDTELFRPIDTEIISIDNPKHLFLLAYRSIFKTLYTQMKVGFDSQIIFLINNENNSKGKERFSNLAITDLLEAWVFWKYKNNFDKIYINKKYELVSHLCIEVESAMPTIAASSVYSLKSNLDLNDDSIIDPQYIVLNIFPSSNKHFIIFSFLKKHTSIVIHHLDNIKLSKGDYQKYLISKLILTYCENFVLSPKYVSTFSEEKRNYIINYFIKNLFLEKYDSNDPNLYLF